MEKTMIIGSPEHKRHIQEEADARIEKAMAAVGDEGLFSEGQIYALKTMVWEIRHAISKTI